MKCICGVEFEGKSWNNKYCSGKCRRRESIRRYRKKMPTVLEAPVEAPADDKIVALKNLISSIENKPISVPVHYCLACQRIGKQIEAVGEFEKTFEDGEHKVWLCKYHLNKL